MRVLLIVRAIPTLQLEAPYVITYVAAGEDSNARHVDQDAVDRDAVDDELLERARHLRVRHRMPNPEHIAKDRDPRLRATKAGSTELRRKIGIAGGVGQLAAACTAGARAVLRGHQTRSS